MELGHRMDSKDDNGNDWNRWQRSADEDDDRSRRTALWWWSLLWKAWDLSPVLRRTTMTTTMMNTELDKDHRRDRIFSKVESRRCLFTGSESYSGGGGGMLR